MNVTISPVVWRATITPQSGASIVVQTQPQASVTVQTVGLQGPQGATGGSILSGTGAPAGATGNNGDMYFDTAARLLYGPKAAGSWGSAVSLVGQAGTDGADGADGLDGTNGVNGIDGADGASAYEIAVANGFVGNEVAWLTSLVGTAGADGADGADGVDGTNGVNGTDGASAYEIAVANGFVGNETAWLASLVGAAGADGAPGTRAGAIDGGAAATLYGGLGNIDGGDANG